MKLLLLLILIVAPQKFVPLKPEPVRYEDKTRELDESLERHWQEIQSFLDKYGE